MLKVKITPFNKTAPSVNFCKKVYDISKNSYDLMLALEADPFGNPPVDYVTWAAKNTSLQSPLDEWFLAHSTNDETRQAIIAAALVIMVVLEKNGIYVQTVANANAENQNQAAEIILSAGYTHGKLTRGSQVIHPQPQYTVSYGSKSIKIDITNAQGKGNTYMFFLMENGVTVNRAGNTIQFTAPAEATNPVRSFQITDTKRIAEFTDLPTGFAGNVACIVLNSKGYSVMSAIRAVGIGF